MEKKWWTLLAVCAGTFMLLLDVMIVIVALPDIQTDLHGSYASLQWVIDGYALTLASMLLTAGVLADRYGRRLLFTIGLVVFTLGSLLCGVAQDPAMLVASRSFQGIGGSTMLVTSLALLAQSFSGEERGMAFGVWGAVTGVALAGGPILGGLITTGISWRGIFLVNVPIGIAAVLITVTKLDESLHNSGARPDGWGFVLLATGLVSLTYGFIEAGETAWGNGRVLVALPVGAALLICFLVAEAKVANPILDLSLFKVPTFVGGSIAALAQNASLYSVLLYLVLFLQDLRGYSALGTGLRLLINSGAIFVTATLAGRASSRVPVRFLIGPGLLLVGIGMFLMGGLNASSSWTHLLPGLLVGGVGIGLVNPPLASTAVGVVEPRRAGMASGINATFRQVGIAVSIAVMGSMFASAVHRSLSTALSAKPVASHTAQAVTGIKEGTIGALLSHLSPSERGTLAHAVAVSFTGALNDLLIYGGIVALVGAAASFILIRRKDFVATQSRTEEQPVTPADTAA